MKDYLVYRDKEELEAMGYRESEEGYGFIHNGIKYHIIGRSWDAFIIKSGESDILIVEKKQYLSEQICKTLAPEIPDEITVISNYGTVDLMDICGRLSLRVQLRLQDGDYVNEWIKNNNTRPFKVKLERCDMNEAFVK